MSNTEHETMHEYQDVPGCPTCAAYPLRCGECGGEPDERTAAGMKCGRCAYGATAVPIDTADADEVTADHDNHGGAAGSFASEGCARCAEDDRAAACVASGIHGLMLRGGVFHECTG